MIALVVPATADALRSKKSVRQPAVGRDQPRQDWLTGTRKHPKKSVKKRGVDSGQPEQRAPAGTGTTVEWSGRRLEVLKEAVPGVARIAVLANPTSAISPLFLKEVTERAQALGVELHVVKVTEPADLGDAIAAMARDGAGALIIEPSSMFWYERARIAALSLQHRLPTMHDSKDFVDVGGLLAYEARPGRKCPPGKRADSPKQPQDHQSKQQEERPVPRASGSVDCVTEFDFFINVKTATALGLTIPEPVLRRADHLIE
jgi:putative ABC transport system substrate-binding protein